MRRWLGWSVAGLLLVGGCSDEAGPSPSTTTETDKRNTTTTTEPTTTTAPPAAAVDEVEIEVDGEAVSIEVQVCEATATSLRIEAFSSDAHSSRGVNISIPDENPGTPPDDYPALAPGTARTTGANLYVLLPATDDDGVQRTLIPEGYDLTVNEDLRSGSFESFNPSGVRGSFSCAGPG